MRIHSVRVLFRSPLAAGLLVSTLVFLGIVILRNSGIFESTELTAYDWYISLQPKILAADSRIVLIEISEEYIHKQGHWPLTDATLVRILKILISYNPRAIGLDLYRDMPIPPGREELEAILTGNQKIITAMKFGGDRG